MGYSNRNGCGDLLGGLFLWYWILYGIQHIFGWQGVVICIFVSIVILFYWGSKAKRKQEREEEARAKAPCTHGVIGGYNNPDLCTLCHQEKKAYEENRKREAELRRQQADELRSQIKWWKSLDGRQFEKELNSLLNHLGYDTTLTPYAADGGVDIIIRNGERKIIVQCKAHSNFISPGVVRELFGTMIHENADEAWLVTTSGFYSGARSFANGKPIRLLTIKQLLNKGYQKMITKSDH